MKNLGSLYFKLQWLIFLLRKKGVKYTYNYVHFRIFWSWIRKHPLLIKLINWLASYPSYIEIEVTTRCNLKCIICEHTYWNEPNRDMSFEEFKGIIDQFPKLKWIGLTGIGESFINKDFMKMLRYIKSRDILVELYDTFYFIDEKIGKELIKMGVDMIFISLDAATKETYERIRIGSNFERIVNNVNNLIRYKREMKAIFPRLEFHYIVNKLNVHEMLQYVEFVSRIGRDEKIGIQFTRMLHEFPNTKDLFVEVPSQIREEIKIKSQQLGVPISWNLDIPQDKPPLSQCIEWTMPFIFVTGHVIPCCSGNEAGQREFQKQTALGDIFEKSFKEIWQDEKYKSLRRMLRQGKIPLPCRNCCLYSLKGKKSCVS